MSWEESNACSAPDFHRFRLTRGNERELVDVVVDRAPQLDAQKADFDGIRVDTLREIIANKLTTLLSRTELKDVVDLYFLEQAGHDLLAALPDAQTKDGGWGACSRGDAAGRAARHRTARVDDTPPRTC